MKRIKNQILIVCVFFIILPSLNAQNNNTKLSYKVYRANDHSFGVSSTLIYGKEKAVLIDAQFSKSDAYRVLADIIESRKELTHIYISHGDPDFYFGLPIFKNAFPNVIISATAPTVEHIKKTFEKKLKTWKPILGKNGFDYVIIPKVLEGNKIDLEGESITIQGLSGSYPEKSYVWIPSIKMILGGFNLFDNTHLWMADDPTKKDREAWLGIVKGMQDLNPKIVIPKHASKDQNRLHGEAISFTISYLETYEKLNKNTKNSQELINAIINKFPTVESGKGFPLEMGAKVVKKEASW